MVPPRALFCPSTMLNGNGYVQNSCGMVFINVDGELGFQAGAAGAVWNAGVCMWIVKSQQYSVSHIIKTKQIDTTTDLNGYFQTGLNEKQIPIGIGGLRDARYAFHTGSDSDQGRTIRLMSWDGSIGKYSNKKINVIVYYIEV